MHPDLTLDIVFKLFLASLLGGLIGLERELHRKPAGLRTNMFMCVGSALFTILSGELARTLGGDHTRIAAQIIPGIGFIGAGAILRERGSVVGLTTAATIFVNASIGMAVGAGLYWTAVYASLMLLGALSLLGWFESRVIRRRLMVFRLTAPEPEKAMHASNEALAEMSLSMQHFQIYRLGTDFVLEFEAEVTHSQQQKLAEKLGLAASKCEVVPRESSRE